MANEVTLGEIHRVVLNFLQNRNDAIVFGAQAVNLYVDEPRMTQDVDVMSTIAAQYTQRNDRSSRIASIAFGIS